MNVKQLRDFLGSFTDECEVYLEGGVRAKIAYKFESGHGILVVLPENTVLNRRDLTIGEDLED